MWLMDTNGLFFLIPHQHRSLEISGSASLGSGNSVKEDDNAMKNDKEGQSISSMTGPTNSIKDKNSMEEDTVLNAASLLFY